MKENETYATVNATHHVKTLPNEAYGTLSELTLDPQLL